MIGPILFVACVTSEKERTKKSTLQRKISTASVAAMLPLYPLEMGQNLRFYWLHTYFLIEESFSVACYFVRLGNFFPILEGVYSLFLQVCVSVNEFITPRMNAVRFCEKSGRSYMVAVETSIHRLRIIKTIFICDYFMFVIHCIWFIHD
jgi:hypothetical protein